MASRQRTSVTDKIALLYFVLIVFFSNEETALLLNGEFS